MDTEAGRKWNGGIGTREREKGGYHDQTWGDCRRYEGRSSSVPVSESPLPSQLSHTHVHTNTCSMKVRLQKNAGCNNPHGGAQLSKEERQENNLSPAHLGGRVCGDEDIRTKELNSEGKLGTTPERLSASYLASASLTDWNSPRAQCFCLVVAGHDRLRDSCPVGEDICVRGCSSPSPLRFRGRKTD